MAVSYPLSTPNVSGADSMNLTLRRSTGQNFSPFSGPGAVQIWDGAWWEGEITLPPLEDAETHVAGQWEAFVISLRGRYGYFTAPNFSRPSALGAVTGTVVVDGASQTGDVLTVSGIGASITNAFLPGDPISVVVDGIARLHTVIAAADSDATGRAELNIEPELRGSPANGSTVTYTNALGTFRLAMDDVGWDINVALRWGFSIPFIERLV